MKHPLNQKKASWVYLDEELLELWDQFNDPVASLTNTHLLMRLAARPFFDFFLDYAGTIVIENKDSIGKITDLKYRALVESKNILSLHEYKKTLATNDAPSAPTIVLISAGTILPPELTRGSAIISVGDADLFGNVEGVWLAIRRKMNGLKFGKILVAMAAERAWIIPRLESVYNVPVYDISHARRVINRPKMLTLVKKIVRKILRRHR